MGKQVRFYMLPEDETGFLDFVFLKPGIYLLRSVSETPDLLIERVTLEGGSTFQPVYICDNTLPFDGMQIEKKFYQQLDETSGLYMKTDEAYYIITNALDAPFIEYTRSFIRDDGKLVGGRVWAQMLRVQGDKMVSKEPEFISWYEEIAHWIRRNLKHDNQLHAYVSRRAMEWRNKGGEFY